MCDVSEPQMLLEDVAGGEAYGSMCLSATVGQLWLRGQGKLHGSCISIPVRCERRRTVQ